MDDEAVERILKSIEVAYGTEVMQIGANNANFRRAVISGFLYGDKKKQDEKREEAYRLNKTLTGKYRVSATNKQFEPLSESWIDKYYSGEVE